LLAEQARTGKPLVLAQHLVYRPTLFAWFPIPRAELPKDYHTALRPLLSKQSWWQTISNQAAQTNE